MPNSQLVGRPMLWVLIWWLVESALVGNHVFVMMLLMNVCYVEETLFKGRLACLPENFILFPLSVAV